LKEKIGEERKRVKIRKKLLKVSEEVLKTLKEDNEFTRKHKGIVEYWCNYLPVKDSIKSLFKFFDKIKE